MKCEQEGLVRPPTRKLLFSPQQQPLLQQQQTQQWSWKQLYLMEKTTKVYSWGVGLFGQLGHGHMKSEVYPSVLQGNEGRAVVCAAAGSGHSLMALSDGKLLSFGFGKYGQLGQNSRQDLPVPTVVESLSSIVIVSVACGEYFSLVVAANGNAYSFGLGDHGQLGMGRSVHSLITPAQISIVGEDGDRSYVEGVAVGSAHAIAATSSGIYAWGCSRNGKLGLGDIADNCWEPQRIAALDGLNVVGVFCGREHSGILDDRGDLYTWGSGTFGHLGHGTRNKELIPRRIDALENINIKSAVMGDAHTLCLTNDGRVFSWGYGGDGALGHADLEDQLSPKLIVQLESHRISSIYCGMRHSITKNEQRWWIWGSAADQQLGFVPLETSKGRTVTQPTLMPPLGPKGTPDFIACGWSHNLAVCSAV